ncbi:MAG: transcriptional regulator [Burkholderiales bacterium PBB4]|nr:MAG: transcriptional regulator [Burkholderiales bacterium PBB4]
MVLGAIEHKCTNECVPLPAASSDTLSVKNNEKNFKKVVGKNVKNLRLHAALSQEELSERCGIFRTYLSRIESGSANPTLVVLVALAHTLGVQPHELLVQST